VYGGTLNEIEELEMDYEIESGENLSKKKKAHYRSIHSMGGNESVYSRGVLIREDGIKHVRRSVLISQQMERDILSRIEKVKDRSAQLGVKREQKRFSVWDLSGNQS